MRILLDCKDLSRDPGSSEKRRLILTCLALLTKKQGVEWLLLVDRNHRQDWSAGIGNLLSVPRGLPGAIGRKIWSGWQLPGIVKKYRPDRIMKADEIARAPGGADERYGPLSGEEKEAVKQRYAGGKEYFLAGMAGAGPEEIVDLLKGFSLFKKRQRCNMQLVLGIETGNGEKRRNGAGVKGEKGAESAGAGLAGKLATYKYRSDIHMNHTSEEEWRKLVAAAYVFVAPFVDDQPGLSIFNAWKAETPVIAPDAALVQERAGMAALYARPGDPASLAAQMMSLYTNERLRADLIGKGRDRLRSFDWDRSAEGLWEGILRSANQQ